MGRPTPAAVGIDGLAFTDIAEISSQHHLVGQLEVRAQAALPLGQIIDLIRQPDRVKAVAILAALLISQRGPRGQPQQPGGGW